MNPSEKPQLPNPLPAGATAGADTTAIGSVSASGADVTAEIVERLAYQLYQQRGGQSGSALEDWLEAERRINGSGSYESSDVNSIPS